MRSIVIDFSGWVKVHPAGIDFEYIGEDESKPQIINGLAWLDLDNKQKKEYILSSIIEAQIVALDGDYDNIELSEEIEESDCEF
jgi:hypothetical protein